MEIDGSSITKRGSATGFSGSAKVSPIVMVSKPETAMMSPGPAESTGMRSRASVIYNSTIFPRSVVPSDFIQATCCPLLMFPFITRHRAKRPK